MIPKLIHYCWFGRKPMPDFAIRCIESWHMNMPDWEYKLWNEDTFDVNSMPYTKEAYESQKYAFVSDVVRLQALYLEGGLYFDVDFLVYQPFDELMQNEAFAGFEGSKHLPIMMGVCASCPGGVWVKEMLDLYIDRHFIINDKLDCTTNVSFLTRYMTLNGLIQNGKEQYYKDLHIYPVEYFCPHQTTGEYINTKNTYCESIGVSSWSHHQKGIKHFVLSLFGSRIRTKLILIKRKIIG